MPAKRYEHSSLKKLARQLLLGPREVRLRNLERAEVLLYNVRRSERYSFDFVYEAITGYATDEGSARLMDAAKVYGDVLLLCYELAESLDLRVDEQREDVYTMDDLVEMFNVSLRTISRWSRMGLVPRRLLFPNGHRRVAFLQRHVDAFLPRLGERARRANRLRPMVEAERTSIAGRAEELARDTALSFAEIVRRLSGEFSRGQRTVRYVLVRHCAVRPGGLKDRLSAGQLDVADKERVYQLIEAGQSPDEVAVGLSCSRSTVQRAYYGRVAQQILDEQISFVPNQIFERPHADKLILGAALPRAKRRKSRSATARGAAEYGAMTADPEGEEPLLTREQEQDLFRRYNYLKYKVVKLRKNLSPSRANAGLVRKIRRLYSEAISTKQRLIRANLGLVISIAKRHIGSKTELGKLISDGNYSLMLAIEKFDFSRGFRFSTYASWAIMKNYAKSIPEESYQLENYVTGTHELMEATGGARNLGVTREERLPRLREEIRKFVNKLPDRERDILISRFGLFDSTPPRTLENVGRVFDLSKERIRQIEERALARLRMIMDKERLEALLEE